MEDGLDKSKAAYEWCWYLDLQGLIGQVRGFNLDEFLTDYEEADTSMPWALGDHGWISSE